MMTEIDSKSLQTLSKLNPNKSIMLENGFLDGDIKKPITLIPNNWDGEKLTFKYRDKS